MHLGTLDHLTDDFLMSQVQAIEIAHGNNGAPPGGAEARHPLGARMQSRERAHAATSKLRPS